MGTAQATSKDGAYSGASAANLSLTFKIFGNDQNSSQRISVRNGSTVIYDIYPGSANKFQVYLSGSGGTDTAEFNINPSAGIWNHYAVVLNNTTQPVVYENNSIASLQGSFSSPSGTMLVIDELFIICDDEQAFQDVVVWNKQVTAVDVTKLYNEGIWLNPTSVSSSQINDWYKFGYEDYWTGSVGDTLGQAETISSSFGSNNHLSIAIGAAPQFQFTLGDNPFGTTKSDTTIRDELTTALNTKFSTNFGSTTYTGADSATATFKISRPTTGIYTNTLSATEISSSFLNITTNDGTAYLPQAARESIREIIINDNNATSSNLANSSRATYQGSTYARRRFTNTYRVGSSITQTVHSGINYNLQKNRDYIWSAVNRGSRLTSQGIPVNVLIVGAGVGQGVELPSACDDVEIPNEKKKYNTTVYVGKNATSTGTGGAFAPINDSASYNYAIKGAHNLPFDIFSGSITTGYNSAFATGFRADAYVTNMHSDTTDFSNDVAMQGPFASQWVGGHQSRHIDLNRYDATLRDDETGNAPTNNLHNQYTRAEGWLLKVVENDGSGSDGAFGIVDPQYGVTKATNKYPDTAKKSAVLYRDGRVKRAMNIANIQTTTSSINHGNYYNNYELISVGGGKQENNLYFRKNTEQSNYLPSSITQELPQTTNPMTLIGQQAASAGNVFGIYENNRQPDGKVIVPAVASAFASGSFVVTGAYVAATTAGNATFRVHATGSQFKSNEGIKIVDGAGNDKRFFFRDGSLPPDSDPNFYIATGSSNTIFWNNIDSKIEAQTPFAVSYSQVTPGNVESLSLTSSAASPSSAISTGSLPSQYTTNQFSFSGWFDITGSSNQSRDKVVFQFASSSGGPSRELFISSSGDLYYKAISNGASVGTQCIKTQFIPNFESTYQTNGLIHLVVSHDYGSGPGSVVFYIDNAAVGSTSNNISVGGAGVCGATMALVTPDGSGSIFNNNVKNKQFHGTGSNFVFWDTNLSSTHVDYIYNKGHYVNFSTALYCDVSIGNNIIAWFPLEKESSGGTDIISGSNFSVEDANNNFTDTNAGPPGLPYANFTLTAPATGPDYNTTLTNSGFGAAVICGTVTNLSNGTGGANYKGAYPSGSIVLDKTFVMAATAAGPSIAVPQFTGGTNTAFWNALSQSVKNNTIYDNIVVDTSAGHQAVFHLTASQTGSVHNKTITTSGANANLTFPGTEIGFAGGINFVSASLSKDITIDRITGSVTKTIITSRFSAPGSIDTLSYGYLDAYSQEYSVYNNLNYRNLSVRGAAVRVSASADGTEFYAFGGSGEATTIRMNNQLNQRDGLKSLLTRHCGKYGTDSRNVPYSRTVDPDLSETEFQIDAGKPSFHKQQRNENRRPSDTSTILAPVLVKRHDNMYISTPIPRSDFQYTWVTSSLGSSYSITSGKQRMYGYAHPTGILSSSVVIDGDSGFVPAITFPTASEIFGV